VLGRSQPFDELLREHRQRKEGKLSHRDVHSLQPLAASPPPRRTPSDVDSQDGKISHLDSSQGGRQADVGVAGNKNLNSGGKRSRKSEGKRSI